MEEGGEPGQLFLGKIHLTGEVVDPVGVRPQLPQLPQGEVGRPEIVTVRMAEIRPLPLIPLLGDLFAKSVSPLLPDRFEEGIEFLLREISFPRLDA